MSTAGMLYSLCLLFSWLCSGLVNGDVFGQAPCFGPAEVHNFQCLCRSSQKMVVKMLNVPFLVVPQECQSGLRAGLVVTVVVL